MASLCPPLPSSMKALVTLLLLGWLGLVWCCSPKPEDINIARNGVATQSSTFLNSNFYNPNKSIDGVTNQNMSYGSCCHTNADWEPWWKLDLKQRYKVNVVVVYSRKYCCPERMKDAEIRIGDSPNIHNPVCGTITDYNITTTTFCCNGMEGRYVYVVIPGRIECLHTCEVEVYGDQITEENAVC